MPGSDATMQLPTIGMDSRGLQSDGVTHWFTASPRPRGADAVPRTGRACAIFVQLRGKSACLGPTEMSVVLDDLPRAVEVAGPLTRVLQELS